MEGVSVEGGEEASLAGWGVGGDMVRLCGGGGGWVVCLFWEWGFVGVFGCLTGSVCYSVLRWTRRCILQEEEGFEETLVRFIYSPFAQLIRKP